jgi:hypothetical protein
MENKIVHEHRFEFGSGGGESLSITTKFIDNGDPEPEGIYWNQKLTLQSYCNSAIFDLCGTILDSNILRQLANELDKAQIEAQTKKASKDKRKAKAKRK